MIGDVTLCFATSRRPHCAQRFILSVRRRYPALKIIVADQSADEYEQSHFYRQNSVEAVFIPADSGVAKARNAAVDRATTEFIIIADDDFIFCDETNLDIPVAILRADAGVDIVGGLLYDIYGEYDPTKLYQRRWERCLLLDQRRKALVGLPIDYFAPEAREFGGYPYFMCDAVMNWAVMRRSVFFRGARWDERYICNGEHEDFYLNIKLNTDIKVAYCPDLVAYHHHPKDLGYFPQRERGEGWRLFAEKWGISQYLTLPWGWMELDGASQTVMPSGVLSDFLERSGKTMFRPSKGEDVAVSFSPEGVARISRTQTDPVVVTAWISNYGALNLPSEKGTAAFRSVPVPSEFRLGDINDIKQLFIRPVNKEAIELRQGETTSFHVIAGTYDGSSIGSVNGEDKIYLGYRVTSAETGLISSSSTVNSLYTPLVNDLAGQTFQYVNVSVDVEPGEYRIELDYWIDGIGWAHRNEGTLPLRIAMSPTC